MLQAMLEATGRITTLARQASDLGAWLHSLDDAPLLTTTCGDLFAALDGLTSAAHPQLRITSPSSDIAARPIRADVARLADALLSTAEALLSETREDAIAISALCTPADEAVTIELAPPPGSEVIPDAGFEAGAERVASFERGGSGLALVIASYVLEAHGARVTPGERQSSLLIQLAGTAAGAGDPT